MKAAIFDMDGTLVDSMQYWRTVALEYLQSKGIVPDEDIRRRIYLTAVRSSPQLLKENFLLEDSAEIILEYLYARMTYHYMHDVKLKPFAKEYLQKLNAAHIPCVVATATERELALPLLERLGIDDLLSDMVCGDELDCDKHDVEYFYKLAERVNQPLEECVMFEDAFYSMDTAVKAGMIVYAIEDDTAYKRRDDIIRLAQRYFLSYEELL